MGVWQGLWVARIGVSSFIVTLAGMLYFRGLSMIATNGATVAPLPDRSQTLRLDSCPARLQSPLSHRCLGLPAFSSPRPAPRPLARPRATNRGRSGAHRRASPVGGGALHLARFSPGNSIPCPARRHLRSSSRDPYASHALWRPPLRDRRKSRSGPPVGHRPQARHFLELCHSRFRLRRDRRGARPRA